MEISAIHRNSIKQYDPVHRLQSINEVDIKPATLLEDIKYKLNESTDVPVEFSEENLIQQVQKFPILWDRRHIDYKCRTKIYAAWDIIANRFVGRPSGFYLRKKWQNIRDGYMRRVKRGTKKNKYSFLLDFLDVNGDESYTSKKVKMKDTYPLAYPGDDIANENDDMVSIQSYSSQKSMDNNVYQNHTYNHRDLLIHALKQFTPKTIDEFDGFGMMIAAGLRTLPPDESKEKQIKLLKILYDKD